MCAAVAAGAFSGQKDNANNPNQANSSSAAKSNQPYNKSINPNSSNRPGLSGKTGTAQKGTNNSINPSLEIGSAESKLKNALNDSDPIRKNASIAQMLVELTPANASAMLAAFENSSSGRDNDRLFNDFLYAWARVSGEEAIKYAMDPESPENKRR